MPSSARRKARDRGPETARLAHETGVYPIPSGRRTPGRPCRARGLEMGPARSRPSVLSRGCADAGARALRDPHQVEPRCKMRHQPCTRSVCLAHAGPADGDRYRGSVRMRIVRLPRLPIVELRESETGTALLMFAYSFLAMTAYNIIQPITRSRFISSLGADNLPYVLLVSVFIVGAIMQGYSRLGGLLPGEMGRAGHAGRDGRRCSSGSGSRAGLGLDVGGRRLLPLRPDLRDSAHQPVLDAGQHHLRPAPGEAAVRVHRRRCEPRRHRRRQHHVPARQERSATPT